MAAHRTGEAAQLEPQWLCRRIGEEEQVLLAVQNHRRADDEGTIEVALDRIGPSVEYGNGHGQPLLAAAQKKGHRAGRRGFGLSDQMGFSDRVDAAAGRLLQPVRLGDGQAAGQDQEYILFERLVIGQHLMQEGVAVAPGEGDFVQNPGRRTAVDNLQGESQRVACGCGGPVGGSLEPEPAAGADRRGQLVPFLDHIGAVGQQVHEAPGAQQRRQGAFRPFRREEPLGVIEEQGERVGRGTQPAPAQIDPVEQVMRPVLATEVAEKFYAAAAAFSRAEALAFMHAAAPGGDFGVGAAEEGIVEPDVDLEERVLFGRIEPPAVPEQPFGLPGLELAELFGKAAAVGRGDKSRAREQGGGGVMAMSAVVTLEKAGDDHLRPVAADDVDHVRQDGLLAPDLQAFVA